MYLDFENGNIRKQMYNGYFGLEKESLRVTESGFIASTPHPFDNNPNIDRDFCESQIEIITNVFDNIDELFAQLCTLHKTAVKVLSALPSGKEYLWCFSNPPYIQNETDISIARFNGVLKGKEFYRQYLAQKYGKKKMLFSGIHFNFSLSDTLLREAFTQSDISDFRIYKDQVYLNLAQKITRYSWLIVWLTAASSVMDSSFLSDGIFGDDCNIPFASARCSEIGYWNDFVPILEYSTLSDYIQSIESYIRSGQITSASELYYPVRLKPKGENTLQNLENNGIDHIELRMLDLNPLHPIGLFKTDLEFLHLFLIFLLSLDVSDFSPSEQLAAIRNIKNAAKYNSENSKIELSWNNIYPVKKAAILVLEDMAKFFGQFNDKKAKENIAIQKNKALHSSKYRYAEIVRRTFGEHYVVKGLALSEVYAQGFQEVL